eukprot:365454-Chlamydomonas_euryale.AAC.2
MRGVGLGFKLGWLSLVEGGPEGRSFEGHLKSVGRGDRLGFPGVWCGDGLCFPGVCVWGGSSGQPNELENGLVGLVRTAEAWLQGWVTVRLVRLDGVVEYSNRLCLQKKRQGLFPEAFRAGFVCKSRQGLFAEVGKGRPGQTERVVGSVLHNTLCYIALDRAEMGKSRARLQESESYVVCVCEAGRPTQTRVDAPALGGGDVDGWEAYTYSCAH